MYVSITRIKLKSPFHVFAFFLHINRITAQLKKSECKKYRLKGGMMTHYTMTLWRTKEDMNEFVKTGAYAKAMKAINSLSSDFTTTTMDSYNLIPWNEAKSLIIKEARRQKIG